MYFNKYGQGDTNKDRLSDLGSDNDTASFNDEEVDNTVP